MSEPSQDTTAGPAMTHRLFAKRAAIIANRAADWSATALSVPADMNEPVSRETAERFAAEIRHAIDIIVRDAADAQ